MIAENSEKKLKQEKQEKNFVKPFKSKEPRRTALSFYRKSELPKKEKIFLIKKVQKSDCAKNKISHFTNLNLFKSNDSKVEVVRNTTLLDKLFKIKKEHPEAILYKFQV